MNGYGTLVTMLVLAGLLLGCSSVVEHPPGPMKQSLFLMDTVVEITAYGERTVAEAALAKSVSEMKRLEALFDRHRPDSMTSTLEQRAGVAPTALPPDYATVLEATTALVSASQGAFDPTIAAVSDGYAFASTSPRVLTDAELAPLLARCGWHDRVRYSSTTGCLLTTGTALDFGGVAKGYIVDRGLAILKDSGLSAGLVNAGGDLRTFGRKPGNLPFRIGLQNPDSREHILGVITLENRAIATSGDYERFFERDGLRWHHLLDPRTGRPGRLSRSATVIASSALVADALATTVFVLGPDEGLALAEGLADVDAALITTDNELRMTSGFARYYTAVNGGKEQ